MPWPEGFRGPPAQLHDVENVQGDGPVHQEAKAGHISATTQPQVPLPLLRPQKSRNRLHEGGMESPDSLSMPFIRVRFTQSTCDVWECLEMSRRTCWTYPNPGPGEDPSDHLVPHQETAQTLQGVPTGVWQPQTPLSHIMSYQPVVSFFHLELESGSGPQWVYDWSYVFITYFSLFTHTGQI